LQATYAGDGALTVSLTYAGGKIDALALVMDLNGPVDTVVADGAPFASTDVALPDGEGLLWGNAAPPVPAADRPPAPVNRGRPGVPRHLFWGNGDRGFTWLCDRPAGWTVTPVAPTIVLSRDEAGMVTWRAMVANHPAELKGEKTVVFTLLTHPAVAPKADQRAVEWLAWPNDGKAAKTPPLTAAGRTGAPGLVRADRATAYEALANAGLLEGPAGGDARSAAETLADTWPLPLFRYLAGAHTGLPVRLKSNARWLSRPGMSPAGDRMAIGRALLHDIGCDPEGVAHLAMTARVMKGLADFGFFAADGKTEYLPYWRSGDVLRYGQPFSEDDAFAETTVDPLARVHVAAWLRPAPAGKKGRRTLVLVVNEGDQPVREQLYILDPVRLFGGPNGFRKTDMIDLWDGAGIPPDSDWSLPRLRREGTPSTELGVARRGNVPFLLDMEDGGGVAQSVAAKDMEVYHRLYVPARGFRLLYGAAEP